MFDKGYFDNEFNNDKTIGNYCIHKYYDYREELFHTEKDPDFEITIGFIYKFNYNNIVGVIKKHVSTNKIIVKKYC